ncbi:MAG TPA: M4 family metallopeptidase, partial [Ilumatobacteraceae bacterium]|nr:M4 family metallopeptidase [Ilumatobacteraceae bacterium]
DPIAALAAEAGASLSVATDPETGQVSLVAPTGDRPLVAAAEGVDPIEAAGAFAATFGAVFLTRPDPPASAPTRTERVASADDGVTPGTDQLVPGTVEIVSGTVEIVSGTVEATVAAATQWVESRVTAGAEGSVAVRYQQHVGGIPVFAGEIAVQVAPDGSVRSATGEASAVVSPPAEPQVTSAAAQGVALAAVAKALDGGVSADGLQATPAELWWYDPQLIGAGGEPSLTLTWRTEVTGAGAFGTAATGSVRQTVLIDARTGGVALRIDNEPEALDRLVCNNAGPSSYQSIACNTTQPGRVYRAEGGPATGEANTDTAYAVAGATYDYFAQFGRDSLDDQGMPLQISVNFCPSSCGSDGYKNAYWSGTQAVFGKGYALADDIVAHELTHGVVEHTAGLLYYSESGAINESFADIFGELIDRTTTASGADPAIDDWYIGEQIPTRYPGIRSMKNPTASPYLDPDRMTSVLFHGAVSDNRGVHTNSGVGNKAAYLIAAGTGGEPGGSFNGQTITGIGLAKTGLLYYTVLTQYLGAGSDYLDLYHGLQQACAALAQIPATTFTATDCAQVTKAVTVTEMHRAPIVPGARLTAPMCASDEARDTLFSDDFESGADKWRTSAIDLTTGLSAPDGLWRLFGGSSQSGTRSLYGPNVDFSADTSARMADPITIPPGTTYLRFDHSFNLEASGSEYYDGGVVEYSTTGSNGPWLDTGNGATALPTVNGYTGRITTTSPSSTNPLRAKMTFSGNSPGYQTTRIDVSALAGRSVLFRFRIGTDSYVAADGWFIDDVAVYRCGEQFIPTGPVRVFDTRPGQSPSALVTVPKAGVGGDAGVLEVAMTGLAGVTPPTGVTAVSLNVTATEAAVAGFVTVYPCGQLPGSSSVNFQANSTVPNAVITPVSATGTVCFFANTPVHVVVDINGWIVGGTGFEPVGPARVFDTRANESPTAIRNVPKVRVGPDSVLTVQMADLDGFTPATGVAAVSLNVTVTGSTLPGFVTVYPCGSVPFVSSLNYTAGATVANAAIAPVSDAGTVCFRASSPVDVVVDVNGWFAATPGHTPVGPVRVIDTRGESPEALVPGARTMIGPATPLVVTVAGLGD